MNAAELLVRCLENEGVRYVFGIPGEETLALNEALDRSDKIRFILTRHEQGAAFMADVYGRLSSFPGVCLATLGPGATNLLTGVADAQRDRASSRGARAGRHRRERRRRAQGLARASLSDRCPEHGGHLERARIDGHR